MIEDVVNRLMINKCIIPHFKYAHLLLHMYTQPELECRVFSFIWEDYYSVILHKYNVTQYY